MTISEEKDLRIKISEYLVSQSKFTIEDIREKVFGFSPDKEKVLSILSDVLESNLFLKNLDGSYVLKSLIS